jgi:hypothetical protein
MKPINWSQRQLANADPGTTRCLRGDRRRWTASCVRLSVSDGLRDERISSAVALLRRCSGSLTGTIFEAWNHARQHSARQCRVDGAGRGPRADRTHVGHREHNLPALDPDVTHILPLSKTAAGDADVAAG